MLPTENGTWTSIQPREIRYLLPAVAAFGMIYFLAAELGNFLSFRPAFFSSIWPPSGLFLAVLLFAPASWWPFFLPAACAANVASDLLHDRHALMSLLFSTGNCLEALAGAALVRKFTGKVTVFSRLREAVAFIFATAFVSTCLSATIGTATVKAFEGYASISTWFAWWSGDAISILVISPVVLAFGVKGFFKKPLMKSAFGNTHPAEIAVFLVVTSVFLYFIYLNNRYVPILREYFLIPLVVWAALRFDLRTFAIISLIISFTSLWSSSRGFGDLSKTNLTVMEKAATLQIFLALNSIIGLVLHTLQAERDEKEESLQWDLKVKQSLSNLYMPLSHSSPTMEETSGMIYEQSMKITESRYGYISVVDRKTGDNVIYAYSASTDSHPTRDNGRVSVSHTVWDGKHRELSGTPGTEGKAFFTNDAASYGAALGIPQGHIPVTRFLRVPVMAGGDAVGQIALAGAERDYTERDLAVVRSMAEFLAVAIRKMETEKALRESEDQFRALVEHAPEAIFVQTEGRFAYLNPVAARLYGAGNSERLIGTPVIERFHPDFQKDVRERIRLINEERSSVPAVEERQIKLDGTVFDTEVSAVPIAYQGKNGALVFFRDVTERKKAEERLTVTLQEKETLLRELYHRTKNNMQVIISLLRLQTRNVSEPSVLDVFDQMEKRIQSMALVHQMLYRSRDLSSIDMQDYLSELTSLLMQSSSGQYGAVKLRLECERIMVLIDTAISCGLIVNELVTNALKYGFPDDRSGEIFVGFRKLETGELELVTADTGVGVPDGFDFTACETLGMKIVLLTAEQQLQGSIDFGTENGLSVAIRFRTDRNRNRVR